MMLPMTVYITVERIPAKAKVMNCKYSKGNYKANNPEDYFDHYELDYELLDRKGYPAPWLQEKLDKDPNIQDNVENQIIEEIKIIQKNL